MEKQNTTCSPRYFLVLLLLLFSVMSGEAAGPFILKGENFPPSDPALKRSLEYLEDPGRTLAFKDIHTQSFKSFEEYEKQEYRPESAYWFRLKVICRSEQYHLWFLEILNPFVDQIQAWYVHGKDTVRYDRAGAGLKFSEKYFKHKNLIFPFKASYKDTVTIYFLHINKKKSSVRIGIRPAEQFSEYAFNEYYFLGLFYGMLCIMGLYNFFIYISTRDTVYLSYILYIFCYCLNSLKIDGLGAQYFWPEMPFITTFIGIFSPLLLISSFYLYSRQFLRLKHYAPVYEKLLNGSMILYGGLFLFNYLIMEVSINKFFYLIPFAIIYLGGMACYRKGNTSAIYFLVALTIFLSSFTIFILRSFHLIPTNIFTVYSLNFGFVVEVVIFSYGMGQQLKMQREKQAMSDKLLIQQLQENERLKDSINRELEDKVRERTLEVQAKNIQLSRALEELQTKNEQIKELNKMLELDNQNLNQDIKEITRARFMLKDLSFEEFQKIYPDEEACFKYLSEIKWVKPYTCKKCGNKEYYPGKTPYGRRCTKCHYDESVISHTIFHNSKMNLTTSFYLTYLVIANKSISSHTLSEKLGLRQKTCWAYKKKILEIMEKKNSGKWNSKDWGKIFYS